SMNKVGDRIDILGFCTVETLRSACTRAVAHRLVICDAEGAEELLLDPVSIPRLRSADILVEVHDDIRPNVSQAMRSRFAATHRISAIAPEERRLIDLPSGIVLDSAIGMAAMDECRGAQNGWLWMTSDYGSVATCASAVRPSGSHSDPPL